MKPFKILLIPHYIKYSSNINNENDSETMEEEKELVPVLLETDIVSTDEILLYSGAGIVMDVESGKVLYYKNPFDKKYPAILTKLMTTLIALENCSMDETVTVSQEALDAISWDSTRLGVLAGQTLTMEEALYAVMVTSANDIANAVGEHIAGSMEAFADMMNDYAKKMGCYHSHFMNANGLHDDNHYMSVYDAAMIAKAALAYEDFINFSSANTYTINSKILQPEENEDENSEAESETEEPEPYVLYSHHKMINGSFPYSYTYGGKTGYTNAARFTLATFAQKDNMNLICILYDAPGQGKDYIYMDTADLLDFCFDNYQRLTEQSTLDAYHSDESKLYPFGDYGFPQIEIDAVPDNIETEKKLKILWKKHLPKKPQN